MRLGLFGGSFDPIHGGHVATAAAARVAYQLERVLFLPTARPPHKPQPRFAPAWARFAMVELALLDEQGLFASACELTLERPAYTIETLERFRREQPGVELWLLLGADSLATLDTWRRFAELPELATLLVLPRPGFAREDLPPRMDPAARFLLSHPRVVWATTPAVEVSSTMLRDALAGGATPQPGFLHPRVLSYIRKYGLYGSGSPTPT